MSTKLSHDLTYDAPLTDVGEMLMEQPFREQVCDAQGAIRKTVSITPEGTGRAVVVDQVIPATGLPSFSARFVGDEINLVQTEHWSDLENATIEVVIPGKPGRMSGTIRLTGSGDATTETVSMDITVNIPLVGGKVESLIADLLRKSLRAENEVGRRYLVG